MSHAINEKWAGTPGWSQRLDFDLCYCDECPHDGAGEGDWCYLCWTNIKTGEHYGETNEQPSSTDTNEEEHVHSTNQHSIRNHQAR